MAKEYCLTCGKEHEPSGAHNLCVLLHSIHQLGLAPVFDGNQEGLDAAGSAD